MKKKYIIVFSAVSIINLIFRFIIINSDFIFCEALYITFLPFLYSFLSLYLIKSEWEAASINLIALIASAIAASIFTVPFLPLTEFMCIALQLPSLLISLFSVHIVFLIPNKKLKILCFIAFIIIAIAITSYVDYCIADIFGTAFSGK